MVKTVCGRRMPRPYSVNGVIMFVMSQKSNAISF